MTTLQPTFYPLGDEAVVVRFGEDTDPDTHLAVRVFTRLLETSVPRGMVEHVSALTTVTVLYDPLERSYRDLVEELQSRASTVRADPDEDEAREIEIPVCYERDFAPDLDLVASHSGLTTDRVIEIHCDAQYVVHMIGFVPGFPYLGGLDERIATPRRESPRDKVPTGSVGIAGNQTGVYPSETPGGWRLIGRTPVRLFSPHRERPSLLHAGDHVRFARISRDEFDRLAEEEEH